MNGIGRTVAIVLTACAALIGCRASFFGASKLRDGGHPQPALEVLSVVHDANAQFSEKILSEFARKNHFQLNYLSTTETVNSQLEIYQKLFNRHSNHPDLFEIDVIWPAILADNLVDLTPYFQKEISQFDPEILQNFTVRGRLLALPTFLDMGVFYYRSDLLKKYGYEHPPSTWSEMERMATVIQDGERQSGNRDFWGYVWQGGSNESLTCNALEWQASAGSPVFLDPRRTIHVRNEETIAVLRRAISWIGRISPPGEPYYRETDAMNLWNEGQAAFMRNWVSSYRAVRLPMNEGATFLTAALPGGPGGQRGALGGLGMAISRFSPHRNLAIEALRVLTSQQTEELRSATTGVVPTRMKARDNLQLMQRTALPGDVSATVIAGLVSRPALVTADKYALASRAYYKAVNAALLRKQSPDDAMAALERDLVRLGGLPERP